MSANYLWGFDGNGTIVSGVDRLSFCNSGKEVYLIRIADGGHNWPNAAGYNAANAIWNFCNPYTINNVAVCANSINDNSHIPDFSIFPNPSDGIFSINSDSKLTSIKMSDVLGNEIPLVQISPSSSSFTFAGPGIYILRVSVKNGDLASKKIIVR